MTSVFGSAIQFMDRLGVYDVLLPFILVFAIMFAILERTKVLGTEKLGDKEVTKRNLNSLVSFVIAFFVVFSSKLVATIHKALANTVVLVLIAVFYLVLIGVFHEEGKPIFLKDKKWRNMMMGVMLVGILMIFANAITNKAGVSWLEWAWTFAVRNWNGTIMGTIIFLILIIGGMVWLTGDKKSSSDDDEDSGGD